MRNVIGEHVTGDNGRVENHAAGRIVGGPGIPGPARRERMPYHKPEEWVEFAEKLAREQGGLLPSPQALIRRGLWGLYACMRRHAALFAHIKQRREIPPRATSARPLAPTRGRGAWVRTLVPTWRHGSLYRTDVPASVLADAGIHDLVFKPPGHKQPAVVLRKTPRLVAWLQALPRRQKGKVIGPFNVDTGRRCITR
jgi:hypothetical protein